MMIITSCHARVPPPPLPPTTSYKLPSVISSRRYGITNSSHHERMCYCLLPDMYFATIINNRFSCLSNFSTGIFTQPRRVVDEKIIQPQPQACKPHVLH